MYIICSNEPYTYTNIYIYIYIATGDMSHLIGLWDLVITRLRCLGYTPQEDVPSPIVDEITLTGLTNWMDRNWHCFFAINAYDWGYLIPPPHLIGFWGALNLNMGRNYSPATTNETCCHRGPTLRWSNMAMDSPPCIDDVLMKTWIYRGLPTSHVWLPKGKPIYILVLFQHYPNHHIPLNHHCRV